MIANTIAIRITLYFLDVISPIVAHVVCISRFVINVCYFGNSIPGRARAKSANVIKIVSEVVETDNVIERIND